MKRLFYILTSLLVLSSCTDELSVSNDYLDIREGENVKVQFSINAPEEGLAETRTLEEITDAKQEALNLYLFVFDSNGLFVQAAKATPTSQSTGAHNGYNHSDTEFTVTLNATSDQCIIHLVAFDDDDSATGLASQISNAINNFDTEVGMIAQKLYATNNQAAYWQRVVSSIEKTGKKDSDGNELGVLSAYYNPQTKEADCIPLVRNFAKVSVVGAADNFTYKGFTIINVPDKGTVAPYKGGFIQYVDNNKTQIPYKTLSDSYEGSTPKGTGYTKGTANDVSDAVKYLYETPNASGDAKGRTALIVKGIYSDPNDPDNPKNKKELYYKVDLIYDEDKELDSQGQEKTDNPSGHTFYNILRNFEYQVTINEVTGYGHEDFDDAVKAAANNNLSASTATSSLSSISDGVQKLEVTSTYFLFDSGGEKLVLKYRYSYFYNGTQHFNNDVVRLTNSNGAIFSAVPTKAESDDADGWRTITMTLNAPTAQALTSNIHIYASKEAINGTAGNSIPASLKESILSGELLYRDVRVDLRQPYELKVVPQSYVPSTTNGVPGSKFRVDLLIPIGVNEALFPMDIYLEGDKKIFDPDAAATVKLPVHVGPSIVTGAPQIAGEPEASFQYTRTITKAEFTNDDEETFRTIDGVTYKVIPCYFKTNVANSGGTIIYASNEYFKTGSGTFSNNPVAFQDNTDLTIKSGTVTFEQSGQEFLTSELFGKKNPMIFTFYATKDAIGKVFTIKVTEGGVTKEFNFTAIAIDTGEKRNRKEIHDPGNNTDQVYYEQVFTYETQTTHGPTISVEITDDMDDDSRKATLAMHRRYFVIAANSFELPNIEDCLDEGVVADGSSIRVFDDLNPQDGTRVGWFGGQFDDNNQRGYLTKDGPRADYVIDRYIEGQNGSPLRDDMRVTFTIWNKPYEATTTIGDLDFARTNTDESQKPKINFCRDTFK